MEPQTLMLLVLVYAFVFAFGYALGKWRGYLDALPKRDDKGRFAKED